MRIILAPRLSIQIIDRTVEFAQEFSKLSGQSITEFALRLLNYASRASRRRQQFQATKKPAEAGFFGAVEKTRTSTGCPTATST
ncbi:MAG: hypothetical protein V7774_19510, partial [Pseudorhizobium pelagicum]|uniref:hypothetical protein n=1 Tax=Pseudorhizobium pelagicum TaxID=1509405 RepID=UPI0034604F7D